MFHQLNTISTFLLKSEGRKGFLKKGDLMGSMGAIGIAKNTNN